MVLQLAAVLPPHDGLCHVELNTTTGFYHYTKDTQLVSTKNLFAVTLPMEVLKVHRGKQ